MQRLLKKFDTAKDMVPNPVVKICPDGTRLGAIYYGSTAPAMNEAWEHLAEQGIHVDLLRVRGFPFNEAVHAFIANHDQVFVVEQNRDAQMRLMLINELEIDPAKLTRVLHYDGTPITAHIIAGEIAQKVHPRHVVSTRETVS